MQEELDDCILKTLSGFEASGITIVEWETRLLRRLDAPLKINPDLMFLVPDEQLDKVNEIAASSDFKIVENIDLSPGF
ncbi:hypothetical protein CFO_g3325 [Ceratocystis platani]|uniref:Uncharacterized protein n=1 Tax=Ceratocystis fimbriata f. sp. platani TaxID=88771 RepID=A0A0F8B0A9_CERFI|nr:hypothetical protein CFO_g3325 [Ceratocystis platani]